MKKHPHVVNEIMTKSIKILRKCYLPKTRAKSRNQRAQMRQPTKIRNEAKLRGNSRKEF